MKKRWGVLIVLLLAGCGTFYRPTATAGVQCDGARCERLWQRAQTWLAVNGRYRIQIINDAVIQTYGPHEGVYDAVAYTLTKHQQPNGKVLISIQGGCHPTLYGCVTDPAPLTNLLYAELEAMP
ncbi:MAG: hypothetical protein Q8M09_12455 [Pseudomonadota bacterium]|nr:hypothetical protein [Pseudomonadota bacterium]MDP1905038.1 hypothetical protein [Pseudomonadota bacterium]MDP2354279.1 hypothetical protein [Pseudomonadota bacterium]